MWHKNGLLRAFLLSEWRLAALTVLLNLGAGLATIAIPVIVSYAYAAVFGIHSLRARLLGILPEGQGFLNEVLGWFAGFVFIGGLLTFGERYATGVLGERFVFFLRNRLFERQLAIPLSVYEQRGAGRYLLRFSGDLKSLERYLTSGVVRFVGDALLLSLAIMLLLMIDGRLSLLFLGGLALVLGSILLLNRPLEKATLSARDRKSGLLSFISLRLRAITTIQLFNREMPEQARFYRKSEQVLDAGIRYKRLLGLIYALVPTLLYAMLGGMLWYINVLRTAGQGFNPGGMLIFVLLLMTMLPALRRLLRVSVAWKMGYVSMDKLMKVFQRAEPESPNLPSLKVRSGAIYIRELSFTHEGEPALFHRFSCRFPGKGLSLVKGPAGSGKSSLLKLLAGVYRPQSGAILIDGQDTASVSGKSLRRKMAIASDEAPLLGRTVFEAISYSRRPEKRQPARQLLSYLKENNPSLPPIELGYPIGELGCRLSKGQRKLLAFGRAATANKPILLIDEPFEGLDPCSLPFWAAEIRKLAEGRTVIVFGSEKLTEWLQFDAIIDLPRTGESRACLGSSLKDKGQ